MNRNDTEARRLLRQRKKRNRQSCFPCRTRKVKCDKCSPCDRCSKSGYPDLCTYDGHRAQQAALPGSATVTSIDNVRTSISPVEDTPHRPASRELDRESGVPSTLDTDTAKIDESPYLGANAVPMLLRHQAPRQGVGHSVENAFMPMMGLGSASSSYPFSSPSGDSRETAIHEIYEALPADRRIVQLFRCYKDVHNFSPVIPDIEGFEAELCKIIEARALAASRDQLDIEQRTPRQQTSISWLSLLFAVLSFGEQLSESDVVYRREKSRIYARFSFQCLRTVNFLVRPTTSCVQTLLVLGQVMQNDSNAELAWILLGTTVRMAQSLGLHRSRDFASPEWQLWAALVRQDSLLSSCYDRPPVTMFFGGLPKVIAPANYADRMNMFCAAMLDSATIGNTHAAADVDFVNIERAVQTIEDLRKTYSTQGSGSGSLTNIRDRCEGHLLGLQSSFMVAWLTRPALRRRHGRDPDLHLAQQLRQICLDNLIECVKSFTTLNTLTTYAVKSWALVHNGLSSALLLALVADDYRLAEVQRMLKEILAIFSQDQDGSKDIVNLSASHMRAIAELKKMSERDAAGGPHTADPRGEETTQAHPAAVDGETTTSNHDSAQDAGTLASAGDGIQSQQGPQDLDLSPLDAFDYILWDPTNTSQLSTDFDPTWFDFTTI